ncbi:MAG: hypothetical protein HQL14_08825 [Candidatus Omnitrophica bacterium]|nr:hypothetical protein [Candidatus Omnitrophota bacterium]
MGKRIRNQRRWREVVLAQQTSGLKPGEFCSKENICSTSFYTWRKRLGLIPAMDTGALAGSKTGNGSQGFIQVRPPHEEVSKSIRIELPNGYRVAVDYIGEAGLKKILEFVRCM